MLDKNDERTITANVDEVLTALRINDNAMKAIEDRLNGTTVVEGDVTP